MNDFKRKPVSLSEIVSSNNSDVENGNLTQTGVQEKVLDAESVKSNNPVDVNSDDVMRFFLEESAKPGSELFKLVKSADILYGVGGNPLNIKPEEVETLLGRGAVKGAIEKNKIAMKQVENYVETALINIFVKHRNKFTPDGKLDKILNVTEMHVINNRKSEILSAITKLNPGLQADRVASAVETFGEMNTDVRYRYESLKEIFCNDYGITPDSYDAYMKAIMADNNSRVLSEGIDKKSDLYQTGQFQEKHKHLLKKVPGWQKGDIVYESEFRKTVDEFEARELEKSTGKNNEKSLELFEGMKNMYRSIDNPLKASDNNQASIGTAESRRNYLERKRQKIKKETKVEEEVKPVEIEQKIETVEQPNDADILLRLAEHKLIPKQEDHATVEVKDKQPVVETTEVFDVVVEKEPVPEPKVIDPKYSEKDYFVNRYDNVGTLDERAKVVQYEADPSVLRTSNPIDRLRLYKESKREGRLLFLINSGYEVFVKKIKMAEKISYMLNLIQESRTTDVNAVDSAVKTEILRVVYDSIEFPDFDEKPNFNEFIKNLSEFDMMTLITMLALVNIPEDKDGRVPLEVTNVICENCGQIAYFKEPITIDLKEEFKHMYPVDVYMNTHGKYKMSRFSNITEAYRSSDFGKMTVIEHIEDDIKYQLITSMPTVWKTQQIKSHSEDMIYNSLRKEIHDRFNAIQAMDRTSDLSPLKEYLENHSFIDYKKDIGKIIDMDVEEMNSEENKQLSQILTDIESKMEEISNFESVFMFIMEYIDVINITTNDGVYIVKGLTLDNPDEVLGVLKNLPLELIGKLTDVKLIGGNPAIPVDISYTSEELAGKLGFDEYYGTDEEARENKRRQLENLKYKEDEINEMVDKFIDARDKARVALETDSRCPQCKKCADYKVNYTGILFFWTSKVSR